MNGVLIILPMGFEEIEAVTVIDLLRRANVTVTIAALTYPLQVTGRSRLDLIADATLDSYINNQYSMVILPGGPGTENYFSSLILEQFLKSQKGYIAAICAAPSVLWRYGMLRGKKYTCHPSVRGELTEALDEPVVVDGKIITSTGAGTAFPFGLKLVELMTDFDTAWKIAQETVYLKQEHREKKTT